MTGSIPLPTNANGMFKFVSYNYTFPNDIPGLGTVSLDQNSFGVTPISGYSLLGIIRYDIGHKGLGITGCAANSEGRVYVTVTNRLTSAVGRSYNIGIQCLWVKSEFLE